MVSLTTLKAEVDDIAGVTRTTLPLLTHITLILSIKSLWMLREWMCEGCLPSLITVTLILVFEDAESQLSSDPEEYEEESDIRMLQHFRWEAVDETFSRSNMKRVEILGECYDLSANADSDIQREQWKEFFLCRLPLTSSKCVLSFRS
jgi:hypothetical protein